ncbi:FecR family protein [Desulfovibrio sp. OttesenSCG-928-F20]|nr:FecR family protein [Desulfovibrio sp. OttesenSCG-928-F20]
MSRFFFRFSCLFLCFSLFVMAAAITPIALANDDVGNVIAARKTAWAERNAEQNLLASKSPVYTGDTLTTNPSGRLQVLFRDDSVLMMAPNTSAKVTEYVYGAGKEPSFNLNLARGLTRMISGGIVEAKPGAMRVETAEVIIGIRGSEFACQSLDGVTLVSALSTAINLELYSKLDGKTYWLNKPLTTMIFDVNKPGPPIMKKMDLADLKPLTALAGAVENTQRGSQGAEGTNAIRLTTPKQLVVDAWSGVAVSQVKPELIPPTTPFTPLPPIPINPIGTYTGTYSGSHNGGFNMTISGLISAPQVTGMNMDTDLNLTLVTPRPVNANGAFDMNFDMTEFFPASTGDILNIKGAATGTSVDMDITGTAGGGIAVISHGSGTP